MASVHTVFVVHLAHFSFHKTKISKSESQIVPCFWHPCISFCVKYKYRKEQIQPTISLLIFIKSKFNILFQRSESANLSMREKSTLKRRINREHNSNFRAGYININEAYLHKTGIRGRKRYFLYCVVAFLVIIALLNALVWRFSFVCVWNDYWKSFCDDMLVSVLLKAKNSYKNT